MAKAAYRPGQTSGVLISTAGVRRVIVVHARCGHTLRLYIRPHFRKCGAVVALKLHLVLHTASRPHGFPKQALCKVAFAGVGRTAVGASRSLRALRTVVCTPLWCASTVALIRRCALRFGQWPRPVMWCLPRPPWASPLRGIGLRGLPVRPQGAPSEPRKVLWWSGS